LPTLSIPFHSIPSIARTAPNSATNPNVAKPQIPVSHPAVTQNQNRFNSVAKKSSEPCAAKDQAEPRGSPSPSILGRDGPRRSNRSHRRAMDKLQGDWPHRTHPCSGPLQAPEDAMLESLSREENEGMSHSTR
jgi:hypothetical protein